MTGQQLKNSILQMAVQGKLVPQDPNDEPAAVLLERIRAEKERLVKEGKIKKEKNPSVIFRGADNLPYEKIGDQEPVCIADEVPFEIPESWEWVTLKQIAISDLGKTMDKGKNKGDLRPYLCSINVYWSGIDLSKVKQARFEQSELFKYRLRKGDLLICEGGDVGRSAVWDYDEEMYYQNALHRVRFYGGINPYFFRLLLECYKGNQILDNYSKGMTIKHLVQSALNSIYFPLPPLEEQGRILSKVSELLPHLNRYEDKAAALHSLNTDFPNMLKKSILQWAVQGKLVPQDPNDEPASVLLERIRAEKEQLVKAGKIKRDKHESVIYRRDNSYYEKVDGIERCIDDEVPFDVPKSWEWCRICTLFSLQAGKNITASEISEYAFSGSVPCYGGNGVRGFVKVANRNGDYPIIGRQGALCGNINRASGAFYATEHAVCVKTFSSTNISWACIFLEALDLNQYATATAQPGLAVSNINTILIPLPPLSEQKRIAEKIESILPMLKTL